uniref:Rho guanine nucleotide exchange factor (GEF) 12a n=1 Tax=Astatotilapia calliptera TaxID=8154 RepID=A0AAX7UEY5_ASTCA
PDLRQYESGKYRRVIHLFQQSLVQRCVIIQKDENGFGLTVSGDNPVFVQLVKEDGAAMRAGVQTGDRIIKVFCSSATMSFHCESYRFLLQAGSYVALTVLGRPPGLAQIPLPEAEPDMSLSSPNSPAPRRPCSPQDSILPIQQPWVLKTLVTSVACPLSAMKEEYSRNPSPKLLKDIQEAEKHIPQLQGQLPKAIGTTQVTNGQCNSFNSIELLKSRPAHLAAFLYHVISQFDPAPVLCYLYADLYKQTNSKETRRVFMGLHNFFIDRGANLKVGVPESVSADLDRRRTELIPEEINRQHVQTLQDSLLPDIQKNLEDFRQKRSMGLTVAEAELGRLDQERVRDRGTLERERSYAENIIAKIDDILVTTQLTEEEKCTTMQYVIYTYMKHLGVRVKEPRSLESKRLRISFLPMIKERWLLTCYLAGGTPIFGPCRVSEILPSDSLDGLPYSASQFDPLYNLDQLPEDDRESDRLEGLGGADIQSEDDQGTDSECDPPNWQHLVRPEVLAGLRPHEIKRQEVIHELFYTERAHVRMLKVLDNVFYQKLTKDSILPPADIKNIFSNLEEFLSISVLSWEEKIKQAVGTFCSNQPFALELIKTKQKKDSRFTSFILEAESNRQCRRLQLKDIIPVEMLRLTKYPLLLDNIVKYTDNAEEKEKVKQAADCCRKILSHVNQAVKESEDKQRLEDYQRRLDLSSLKQTDNPMILELKNLDLTKKTMVHEGPLSWKVNKDKTIELYTLLLEDILVLLQKQDERLILKCHSKNLSGTADTKHIFSPIIKLNTVLVRSVATDNKSFFVLSMSENGAQIYELMAPTVSDQRTWQRLITQRAEAMKVKPHSVIPLPQTVYVTY